MEIEMEDTEDFIIDIDSSDLKDPLAVVEYVDDIYTCYRETQILKALHCDSKEASIGRYDCHVISMQI
ncbi:hypothetical protein REPUB_Repub12eG0026900 [Reevesia pubescens]